MLGRYEEAIRCYDKALGIDPKDEFVREQKSRVLKRLGLVNRVSSLRQKYRSGFLIKEMKRIFQWLQFQKRILDTNRY